MRLHPTVLLLIVATHQIQCKPADSPIPNYLDTATNRDHGLEPRTGGSLGLNTEAKKELWSGDDYHDDEYYGFVDMIVNNNNNNNIRGPDELSAKQLKELAQIMDCIEREGANSKTC